MTALAFWTLQWNGIYGLTGKAAAFRRQTRVQARYIISMKTGSRYSVPSLEEELWQLAIGLMEREYHFSLDMWLLLGQPRPSGWSHTQEYMGSTIELSGLKCKKGTQSQVGMERVHLKQVGAGLNVIKRCCIKFSRS